MPGKSEETVVPDIKIEGPRDRANLVNTRGSSVNRRYGETGTRCMFRSVPWIWEKNPKRKKVWGEVLRDKDSGIGERLPLTGERRQRHQ